jgi:hypothetical protein
MGYLELLKCMVMSLKESIKNDSDDDQSELLDDDMQVTIVGKDLPYSRLDSKLILECYEINDDAKRHKLESMIEACKMI